jgi:hypothetical protein
MFIILYKHILIVNDICKWQLSVVRVLWMSSRRVNDNSRSIIEDNRVTLQIGAPRSSLTIVIYECNMFILQASGGNIIKNFWCKFNQSFCKLNLFTILRQMLFPNGKAYKKMSRFLAKCLMRSTPVLEYLSKHSSLFLLQSFMTLVSGLNWGKRFHRFKILIFWKRNFFSGFKKNFAKFFNILSRRSK